MRKFTCAVCEETFPVNPGWTDEMAREEFHRLYPGYSVKDVAKTCDECHAKIEEWRRENGEGGSLQ